MQSRRRPYRRYQSMPRFNGDRALVLLNRATRGDLVAAYTLSQEPTSDRLFELALYYENPSKMIAKWAKKFDAAAVIWNNHLAVCRGKNSVRTRVYLTHCRDGLARISTELTAGQSPC